LSPRMRHQVRALAISGLKEGEQRRVADQLRGTEYSRVVLDGAGATLGSASWCKLLRRALLNGKVRELALVSVSLDRGMVGVLASFLVLSNVLDLSFDRCALLSASLMRQLAAGVAASSVRRFSFSKESFSKSECRAALAEFFQSFSLLNLSISSGFEKHDAEVTSFLAQNHKSGLHLEVRSPAMVFSHRLWTCLPRGWHQRIGTSVVALDLSHNALTEVPPMFACLTALETLDLSSNHISEMPLVLRELPALKTVAIADNPVASRLNGGEFGTDWRNVLAQYAQQAAGETMLCSQVRVLVVGERGAGRSALCKSLGRKLVAKRSGILTRFRESPGAAGGGGLAASGSSGSGPAMVSSPISPTSNSLSVSGSVGVTLGASEVDVEPPFDVTDASGDVTESESLVLKMWDFASDVICTPAPLFYVCNDALYVVVFRLLSGSQIFEDIEEWLSCIEARMLRPPHILLVGTFRDKAPNAAAVASSAFEAFRRRKKSRVHGCVAVDATNRSECNAVRTGLKKMALEMEGHAFLGHSFPRAFVRLAGALRAEAAQAAVPCVSLERFQSIARMCGVKSGAQMTEAAAFLNYVGALSWYLDLAAVRDLVILDPAWPVRVLRELASSERLRACGATFLQESMLRILSPLAFPKSSHVLVLRLLSALGVVHELRATSAWCAYVVPFLMSAVVGSFGEDQGFRDLIKTLGPVVTLNRSYSIQCMPRSLKSAILVALLDAAEVHASIWAHGVVCAARDADARMTLMAQWKDGGREELKLTIVSDSPYLASRSMHIFSTAIEGVLAAWYTPVAFVSHALGRNGVLHPVRRLIADFLRSRNKDLLEDLAPDLVFSQAPELRWDALNKVRDLGAGSFGTVELYQEAAEGGRLLVVKKLLSSSEEGDEQEAVSSYLAFLRECWMMHFLRHGKVIRLVGVCFAPLAMVLDFCSGKDLRAFLDTHAAISWEVKLQILRDVCEGMNWAHQAFPVVAHRDLKVRAARCCLSRVF
jgi:hypothetical protein